MYDGPSGSGSALRQVSIDLTDPAVCKCGHGLTSWSSWSAIALCNVHTDVTDLGMCYVDMRGLYDPVDLC